MTRLQRWLEENGLDKPLPQSTKRDTSCGECNGSGKLTQLGGDWGRTPDREVTCWACGGTGRRA